MCFGGSSSSSSQQNQSAQQTNFAPWVASVGSGLYGNASGYAAANPYKATGTTTSAVTQPQTTAAGVLGGTQLTDANTVQAANTISSVAGAINPNASRRRRAARPRRFHRRHPPSRRRVQSDG